MIKDIEAHQSRNNWTLIKNIEAKNKHKNKDGKIKTILSIWYFKRKRFPDGILMKHKSILCANGVMQSWEVNYSETYTPVVNWINVRSILAIASIHELPSRLIGFLLAFL